MVLSSLEGLQMTMSHSCYIYLLENRMLDCLNTCPDMLMIEIYVLYPF